MNQFLERSLARLGGSEHIDQVEVETLERLTERYPYFPVAQMLLAKKLKSEDNPAFLAQVQKTALYFYNPFWLHYQLLNNETVKPVRNDPPFVEPEISGLTSIDNFGEKEGTDPFLSRTDQAIENVNELITNPADQDRVVLTDGDDNVNPVELVIGPSTLLEPEVVDDKANENHVAGLQETSAVSEKVVDDIPITTEFSLEEIEQSAELAHETLVATDENAEKKLFGLPGDEKEAEDVPITTEFTLEEIEQSAELAHETLIEVEVNENNLFVLPGEQIETTDVPITTEFTLEEIEESAELAHETLADENEKADDVLFALPSDQSLADRPGTNDLAKEETAAHAQLEHENLFQSGVPIEVVEVTPDSNNAESRASDDGVSMLNMSHTEVSELSVSELTEAQTEEQRPNHNIEEAPEVGLKPTTINDKADADIKSELLEETSGIPKVSPDLFSNAEMLKNIKAALDTPLAETKTGINEPLIPIDPYHTVDYFASQGIKLVLEKDPKDKLGKQLKSFTQWLKHMKKVGPEDFNRLWKRK